MPERVKKEKEQEYSIITIAEKKKREREGENLTLKFHSCKRTEVEAMNSPDSP